MIAVGLLATVAAALLSTEEPIGATVLSWEARAPLPDSKPAPIPGGGRMRLSEAGIRATEANAGGYRLYRVAAALTIDAGSAAGRDRVRCVVRVPSRTALIVRTPENRAAYPLPSTELAKQPAPSRVSVEFSSNGAELAKVELGDAFGAFTNQPGVVVDWAPFRPGRQTWEWRLPGGRPARPLRLGFASIWRTTGTPAARISCSVKGAGSTTVRTAGTLGRGRATG